MAYEDIGIYYMDEEDLESGLKTYTDLNKEKSLFSACKRRIIGKDYMCSEFLNSKISLFKVTQCNLRGNIHNKAYVSYKIVENEFEPGKEYLFTHGVVMGNLNNLYIFNKEAGIIQYKDFKQGERGNELK